MKIVGLYNWHDGGYAVLNNGVLEEHIEFERYTRLKESPGDSLEYLKNKYIKKNNLSLKDIDAFVSPCPIKNLEGSQKEILSLLKIFGCVVGKCHVSNFIRTMFLKTASGWRNCVHHILQNRFKLCVELLY